MGAFGAQPQAFHSSQGAATPSTTKPLLLNSASDQAKAYHATGAWGKRGMTLQELTCAFDAFNEDEERVAIGFAWSEDCARKLAEPLSDVKTIFSDLDGLRPRNSTALPTAFPRLASSSETLRAPQRAKNIQTQTTDEFVFIARMSDADGASVNNPSPSNEDESHTRITGVDEDTIKPSHKRRRPLSSVSPTETYSREFPSCRDEMDRPVRPPSRLGFCDDDEEDGDSCGAR